MNRYYSLNDYCKEQFGEKVYRLSLNGGMSCPNRDGFLSTGGCAFCSEGGSGDFTPCGTIKEQLLSAKERIKTKTNCQKFIAYFQAYTNTYAPVSYLREIFTQAIEEPDVVALSIGTRSDCLSDEIIELLDELNQIKPVWVEIGLQTIHNKTLQALNTHTTFEQFNCIQNKLNAHHIKVVAHVILGLPGETKEMMLETIDYLSHSHVWGIKLQLLHILKNTKLGELYQEKPFSLFEKDEYIEFIIDILERLPKEMVIHRITGDGPRALLVAPLWSTDKKGVLNQFHRRMKERNTYQGDYYG